MKLDLKPSTALAVGGITLAGVFCVTAIVSPASLDWIFQPGEELSDRMKEEMERQKEIEARSRPDARPDARPEREEKTERDAATPTTLPEQTVQEGEMRRDEPMPRLECISRDQVVNIIGASEEARESRVLGVSVTPDGRRIMVAYRKKTFLGIGSGENQIEGILWRGLRNRFPDRVIKSVKVQSDGNRSVRRGEQNVNVEVLVIETRQAGCQWP